MTEMLQLLNVESAYGPIRAIRGVSLSVRQGQIATVLGSNGAGKTTILKTISGIIDPRKGSIHFKGQDITAKDPAHIVQQGLSHVPEGREVFPLPSRNIGRTIHRITDLERLRRGFFKASGSFAQRTSKLSMHMSQANRIVKRSLILVVRVAR